MSYVAPHPFPNAAARAPGGIGVLFTLAVLWAVVGVMAPASFGPSAEPDPASAATVAPVARAAQATAASPMDTTVPDASEVFASYEAAFEEPVPTF